MAADSRQFSRSYLGHSALREVKKIEHLSPSPDKVPWMELVELRWNLAACGGGLAGRRRLSGHGTFHKVLFALYSGRVPGKHIHDTVGQVAATAVPAVAGGGSRRNPRGCSFH